MTNLEAGARDVVIVLYPEVQSLDFIGPLEVFDAAQTLIEKTGRKEPGYRITVAGLDEAKPILTSSGVQIVPATSLIDVPTPIDTLIIPGGAGSRGVSVDEALLDWLRASAPSTRRVTSVCTGAFLLGRLGLLEGRRWTTHWEDVPDLAARISGTGEAWVRWVDEGHVVTAGGLSSGIAMALHLVDRFAGRELAVRTARQIEYDWDPESR